MRIWKYPVKVTDWVELSMPLGARVVAFGLDPIASDLVMWVEVDEEAPKVVRAFRLVGTGHLIESGLTYLGTAIGHLGQFVWHLYEPERLLLRDGDGNPVALLQRGPRGEVS